MILKRFSRKKKIVVGVIVALVALFGAGAAYAISIFGSYHPVEFNKTDSELGISSAEDQRIIDSSKEITNVALFGVDSRNTDSFKGNSDSVMVISVDKLHNKIKLTSIMRDSLVKVEGHSDMKLTDVYGIGGPELAIKTINQNFGLNIRNYATINFANMAKIVDAVGGVEIDVSEDELVNANASIGEQIKELGLSKDTAGINEPGLQTLNGIQAVGYARIRRVDNQNGSYGDYGRTDRQREVMEQLFHKALNMDFWEYPEFIRKMIPLVETNLSYDTIFDMAKIMTRNVTFSQTRVPLVEYTIDADYYMNGSSHVYYNLDYAAEVFKAYIYDDVDPEEYVKENTPPTTGHRVQKSEKNTTSSGYDNSGRDDDNDNSTPSRNSQNNTSSRSTNNTSSRDTDTNDRPVSSGGGNQGTNDNTPSDPPEKEESAPSNPEPEIPPVSTPDNDTPSDSGQTAE